MGSVRMAYFRSRRRSSRVVDEDVIAFGIKEGVLIKWASRVELT